MFDNLIERIEESNAALEVVLKKLLTEIVLLRKAIETQNGSKHNIGPR